MKTLNEIKKNDLIKMHCNLGEKPGYSHIVLNPNGAGVTRGKNRLFSQSYLACFKVKGKLNFLACTPTEVSFDPNDKNEIKKVSVMIRNTEKARRAYIATSTDLTDDNAIMTKDLNYADMYESLNDKEGDFSFFMLVTFSDDNEVTSFYFYSNADVPIPLYAFSMSGNPPMTELREFVSLMFTTLTYGMERQQEYLQFLSKMMGGNEDE